MHVNNFKIIKYIIIIIIIQTSIICSPKALFLTEAINSSNNLTGNTKFRINVISEEDIYGMQYDLIYNSTQVKLLDDDIITSIPNINLYSMDMNEGHKRVVIFSLAGEQIVNTKNNLDIVEIKFESVDQFTGTSIVRLSNVILSGKGGTNINLHDSSYYKFKLSFLKPNKTELFNNNPNPFSSSTVIEYQLLEDSIVSIVIYDLKGGHVKTLVHEYKIADYYFISWDGHDYYGKQVVSGQYVLKMTTSNFSDNITMTILN